MTVTASADAAPAPITGPEGVPPKTPNARSGKWSIALSNRNALMMLIPLILVAVLFVIYPIVLLFIDSITRGDGGLSNYASAFGSQAMRNAFVMTLGVSLVTAASCLVMGTAVAWAIAQAQNRFWRALLWIGVLLPFWMGLVVKTYALAILMARNGPIIDTLKALGMADDSLRILYTPLAIVIGMTYTMLPYGVLAMYPTMQSFDKELLNAAESMGSSRTAALVKVWLPNVMPGIIASGAIVFAMSIGFYVTPILLGGAQVPFIASYISSDIFQFYNYPRAAAVSVILLVTAAAVLTVALKFVGAKAFKQGVMK